MEFAELSELVKRGGGYHFEFKLEEESNEDFAKTIACVANTYGGKILIGVGDGSEFIGVSDVDKVMLRLDDIATNHCEPLVTILQESV
ncbi:MAG: hypothetical protein D6687_01465 [Acidobacteria bacterium]|jgi:predicted HTH transcriptional regulator|nr:MAG: hypothetical protein D6687_01465 [Acidobacteriota bacterium]GIU81964.1 MAG: hypothetical protein KatS3mg006_1028 [Pyrinomonadaceae bacterium]